MVDDMQAAGLATPRAGGLAAACPGSAWKISFGSEDSSELYPCDRWHLSSRQKRKESGTFSSEDHSPDSGYVIHKLQELSKSTSVDIRSNEDYKSLKATRAGLTGQGRVVAVPLGGGGSSLHVVEPELLLHVAIRHLAKRLLVVLHELEDGRQLFFLNSVEKKGYRGKRCS